MKNNNIKSIKKSVNRYIYGSQYNAHPASDKYNFWGKLRASAAVISSRSKWALKDMNRLKSMKNIHRNADRAFILCNGYSLNQMDLKKLEGEITFGVNAIFLNFKKMGFYPTYYVVEDNLVAEDRADSINALSGMIKFFPFRLAYCLQRDRNTIYFNHCPDYQHELHYQFSSDASKCTCGGNTVTYTCLQLSFHLGIRKVYLIGADHDYKIPKHYSQLNRNLNYIIESNEDDQNHFHKSYFGSGYRWHNPKVHMMETSYWNAKKFYEEHGGKIYNATKGGKLEVFERVDYNKL